MSDWNEIKRPFREALIAAFNRDRLALVLQYHCDRRLDRITSRSEGFEKNVDDVLDDAVRNGWLEKLAQGALAENEQHTGLKATVPHIVDGVKAEGKAYYQSVSSDDSTDDDEAPVPDVHELHRQLVKQFDLEELRDLCFDLGVEFEDLGGSGKSGKARELVRYMQRRSQLDRLSKAIQEQRG